MRLLKPLSTVFFLTLAVSVTAGSLYVTVNAAVQQEGIEFPALPTDEVPAAPMAVSVEDEVLDPSAVRHDRDHAVRLDATGGFSGRLSSLAKPSGNLDSAAGVDIWVIKGGNIVASTSTADDGSFAVSGLTDGVATIFAKGQQGFLLYSVRLASEVQGFADATPVNVTNSVQIDLSSALVASSDAALAMSLIRQGAPESDRRFNQPQVSAKEEEYPVAAGESSTSTHHHQVQLQADGSLVGQVNLLDERTGRNREVLDLTLHFLRDGQHVGQTEVQRSGEFVISGLAPGIYSVISTGDDGVLAMGLDIVGSFAQLPQDSQYKFASIAQSADFSGSPANAGNVNQTNLNDLMGSQDDSSDDTLAPLDGPVDGAPFGAPPIGGPLGSPVGGGPMGMGGGSPVGGFGGGSGGGIGGGGGFGSLLAAAAAGAAGFAVGDSNNDAPASGAR